MILKPGLARLRLSNGLLSRWVRYTSKSEREKYLRCRKDAELTVCLMEEGSIDPTHEQPRVVIIGAGMAGLSAANRLLQCGIDNFVVLEAADRPGGRIHTCTLGNVICEMGPDKISGSSPVNPIFTLAAREGLLGEAPSKFPRDRAITLTSSGRSIPPLVEATAHHSMILIENQAKELVGELEAKGMSLWDFFSKRILQELEIYPSHMKSSAARKLFGMTNDLRTFLGTCLSDTPVNHFHTKFGYDGTHTAVPTGMVGILAPLLRPMPTCDHILYCKKADKIIWSEQLSCKPDRVKVICCDGTVYPADYVIVTLPLGVLKEKASNMFVPSLSDEKMNAIQKMGYGNICKIVLEYERPFWVWKSGSMVFGWSLAEINSRKTCPDWVKGIGTVDETQGSQQGLIFSVADREATIAEGLSDIMIAEDFTRAVRRFTGDATLPYPANVVKSAWGSNELFRGARPYVSMKATSGHICELSVPIPEEAKGLPAVLFAGDASSPKAMGTLQGARLSGIREAERVLRLTKKLAGRPRPDYMEGEVCRQPNDNIAVSWLKRHGDSLQLISVNTDVFQDDSRYNVNFIKPVDWQLTIRPVNYTDQGYYECQVSSHPPIVHSVYIHVIESTQENSADENSDVKNTTDALSTTSNYNCINTSECPETTTVEYILEETSVGEKPAKEISQPCNEKPGRIKFPELNIADERNLPIKNKFYNSGSTIELRCLIVKVPTPTQFIIWKHNSTILNYDTTRGGISVKTDILPDGAKSQLYIANVGPSDSGNYSCSLGEETVTSVSVVVITGESPAAMQHGSATAVNVGLLTILSIVIPALS